jgi:chorismate dehydratase
MVNISIVNYLNSKPFLEGLQQYPFSFPIHIDEDIPSAVSNKLLQGKTDLALVPVATLSENPDLDYIKPYGIGAYGKVKSVLIQSNKPINQIESLQLDFHSKSSNALAAIVLNEFYGLDVQIGFDIESPDAQVAIGDKTFYPSNFPYTYDLAEEWFKCTQKPFVFAVWAYQHPLGAVFENEFNAALALGLSKRQEIAQRLQEAYPISVEKYYTKFIKYTFEDIYYESITLFLQKIKQLNPIINYEAQYK